eukprot:TRINITY_DN25340_c0_g1_i1.p1 TRINITY_DN25340_c0_g1~~TRINITY_DN25340_c0_g1_i1.p1  ORF type:complete len:292 (+),score=71.71 TRINITY_DN25340_c0_g1_i1:63-878(+)
MTAPSWAVVTGAGSGIGAALARRLIADGISVVAVGRRAQALERTQSAVQEAVKDSSARLLLVPADIAAPEGFASVVKAATEVDGKLRFLVHNAAIGDPSPTGGEIDVEKFRYAMEVNVTAPLALTQALLPRLKEGDGGRVLHLGTGVAHMVQPGTGIYGVTKAAFHRLYQQLAVDLKGTGVLAGSARPGVVDTEGMRAHVDKAAALSLPHADWFKKLFAGEGEMQNIDLVSDFLATMLQKCPADEYSSKEWSINETSDWWKGSDKAHLPRL